MYVYIHDAGGAQYWGDDPLENIAGGNICKSRLAAKCVMCHCSGADF